MAEGRREAWLEVNAELLAYPDHLADQVAERREALGARAVAEAPDHLVELLGPVPVEEAQVVGWRHRAAAIEAYREEWDLEPTELERRPVDGVQRRAWELTVGVAERHRMVESSMSRLAVEEGLVPDSGLDLGF